MQHLFRHLSSGMAACLLLATTAMAQELPPIAGTRLDINATAEIKAKPDRATIQASVVTKGATADAARDANAKLMQAAFKALKDKKILDKDMQTSGLTINPDFVYESNQPPRIAGYQAVNSLTVVLHDLDRATDVIDSLIKNGINQFSGPNFSIAEPEIFLNQARQQAMQKARARADIYATATGLKVKRIVSISENANMGSPVMYRSMGKMALAEAAADSATPIATGQIDLNVMVNVTYELQ